MRLNTGILNVTKERAHLLMKMLDRHITELEHWYFQPQDATGGKFKAMQIDLETLHAALAKELGPP